MYDPFDESPRPCVRGIDFTEIEAARRADLEPKPAPLPVKRPRAGTVVGPSTTWRVGLALPDLGQSHARSIRLLMEGLNRPSLAHQQINDLQKMTRSLSQSFSVLPQLAISPVHQEINRLRLAFRPFVNPTL